MNFLGFAFPLALLVAVQLTTFTWATTNATKTSGKGKKGSLNVQSLWHTQTVSIGLSVAPDLAI